MTVDALAARRDPSRPGPGPVPGSVLRALDLTIGRRVEGLLAGDYRSTRLGPGPSWRRCVCTSRATTSG